MTAAGMGEQRRPPAAQLTGSAVVLQREAVVIVASLVDVGLRYRSSLGQPETAAIAELRHLFATASERAQHELRHFDVEVGADSSGSEAMNDPIDATTAGQILNRSARQVVRMAASLGGVGGGQGRSWMFSRAEVDAYAAAERAL